MQINPRVRITMRMMRNGMSNPLATAKKRRFFLGLSAAGNVRTAARPPPLAEVPFRIAMEVPPFPSPALPASGTIVLVCPP